MLRTFRLLIAALMIAATAANAWAWVQQPLVSSRHMKLAPLSVGGAGFGGITLFGEARIMLGDGKTNAVPLLDKVTYEDGKLCLYIGDACYGYKADADYLGRLISFVYNDGNGAFSAYSPEDPSNFLESDNEDHVPSSGVSNIELGMRECVHLLDDYCADEFAGSETIENALRALDFPGSRQHPNSDVWSRELNMARLPSPGPGDWTDWEPIDYEVSDHRTDFVVTLDRQAKSLKLTGAPLMFDREISSSHHDPSDPLKVVGVSEIYNDSSLSEELEWMRSDKEDIEDGLGELRREMARLDCKKEPSEAAKAECEEELLYLGNYEARAKYELIEINQRIEEAEAEAAEASSQSALVNNPFERGVELTQLLALLRTIKSQKSTLWDDLIASYPWSQVAKN